MNKPSPIKYTMPQSERMATASEFAQWQAQVAKMVRKEALDKYQAELLSMFCCRVSPMGAAVHLQLISEKV